MCFFFFFFEKKDNAMFVGWVRRGDIFLYLFLSEAYILISKHVIIKLNTKITN